MADEKKSLVERFLPGLLVFRNYRPEWLPRDVTAGISVASIALPLAIAYASLTGLPPEAGLYATILPMAVYALFGTSRQLIIGPDSATCVMVGAILAAHATLGTPEYRDASSVVCLAIGVLAIAGGLLKLGFVANFMSRPILTGYLNGLALSIILGQMGKLFGFSLKSEGFFKMLYAFFSQLNETHLLTLFIGASAFVFLRLMKRTAPRVPAPLIVVAVCALLSSLYGFEQLGVRLVGKMAAGFPSLSMPELSITDFEGLVPEAVQLLLVTYCSMMLTNKGFASKGGYRVEPNQEFVALGMSNILSGLSQGFVVSGADSRTAVNDSFGGKTQLVSIVAAATVSVFVIFFIQYIEILPVTILAAIVISASIGLFNISYLKHIKNVSKAELFICMFTTLCVMTLGIIPALMIAVLLSLARLLKLASTPPVQVLGKIVNTDTYHDVSKHPDAVTYPGLLIFRFSASLLFFNSDYFSEKIIEKAEAYGKELKCLLIDGETFLMLDVTGAEALKGVINELEKSGVAVIIAAARTHIREILEKSGVTNLLGKEKICFTLDEGVAIYLGMADQKNEKF